MNVGPILDRGLTVEVLDAALGVAQMGVPFDQALRYLEIALRAHTTEQEATTKTRKILSRIWLRPPDYARPLIEWGISHAERVGDRRVLHLGALLATYPFLGEVCAMLGRQLNLAGEVNTIAVRNHMHGTWGERSSVDVGARRCIRTLRYLGSLSGTPGASRSTAGEILRVPPDLRAWVIHALILTRQASSIDERDIDRAPELFMLQISHEGSKYPYLERVNESSGRRVLVPRNGDPLTSRLL
jgi:hypothetical protein